MVLRQVRRLRGSLETARYGPELATLHRPVGRGSATGAFAPPPPPPQTPEVHFFIDQRLKKSEGGVLFYSNIMIMYRKTEIAVKEVTGLSHPFQ